MGSCSSAPVATQTQFQKARAKCIEERLNGQLEEDCRIVKVLLLGAGECGKSTILKQLKIVNKVEFTEAEMGVYKELAYMNTLESIQTLCRACVDLQIPLEDVESEERSRRLLEIDRDSGNFEFGAKDDILAMWKDSGIQAAFKRSSEFHLLDSCTYFTTKDNIDRIFSPTYRPTQADIVRCRLATTGIIQTDITIDKIKFKLYDVGGQRGERKKWIHSFDSVTAIMFIASLSEYDLVLAEDRTRNRLRESLDLFEGIINLPWFKEAPIILFLNKEDLFKIKVEQVDIGIYFPTYSGGCDYEAGLKFIQDTYYARKQSPTTTIYCHVTDATKTENIAFVWKTTKHIVLEKNLTQSGLAMSY